MEPAEREELLEQIVPRWHPPEGWTPVVNFTAEEREARDDNWARRSLAIQLLDRLAGAESDRDSAQAALRRKTALDARLKALIKLLVWAASRGAATASAPAGTQVDVDLSEEGCSIGFAIGETNVKCAVGETAWTIQVDRNGGTPIGIGPSAYDPNADAADAFAGYFMDRNPTDCADDFFAAISALLRRPTLRQILDPSGCPRPGTCAVHAAGGLASKLREEVPTE
jgi:hypothetical protein